MSTTQNTPILVGVGQVRAVWAGDDANTAPSPLSLATEASRVALADAGATTALEPHIDVVAVVRTNADSIPGGKHPFGRCDNPPHALAARLGISPARAIYTDLGGDTPQSLVNEFSEAIFAGQCRMALLAGGEAVAAFKQAERNSIALDWNQAAEGGFEDRNTLDILMSDYELASGFGYPTWVYPLFDNALRARNGHDRATHVANMSELFSGFSKVAAANPYAQFPKERSADFLARPCDANYRVADPYLKWHVAQDAVNQGAAVVVTSVGVARELGIPQDKWVYLHGYARAKDKMVSERADLSRSVAMEKAVGLALESSGKTAADIDHFDLYSCFPSAVFFGAEALAVDWREQVLTQTGGLPFFGGPGNNYSMHGIASMVERLRQDRGSFGLVLANGGFISKEAIGVYSTQPPKQWAPVSSDGIQAEIDAQVSPALLDEACQGIVETYTVVFRRGEPNFATVVARVGQARVIARTASGDRAAAASFLASDPIGKQVVVVKTDGRRSVQGLV
ncbi:MAG: acetyl-CoA C-acetyltransferase [Hyphomicrobiaceae bacterium]|jgi:acetyl-CoA C-acetyltransferase